MWYVKLLVDIEALNVKPLIEGTPCDTPTEWIAKVQPVMHAVVR